jgi:hypothetical protein
VLIAESWAKRYRQNCNFLVESIQPALSWIVRQMSGQTLPFRSDPVKEGWSKTHLTQTLGHN